MRMTPEGWLTVLSSHSSGNVASTGLWNSLGSVGVQKFSADLALFPAVAAPPKLHCLPEQRRQQKKHSWDRKAGVSAPAVRRAANRGEATRGASRE